MKPIARINLFSAALRRGILVSSLALVAIVANAGWFGKDDTAEFKVGDSETEIIARIPEETKAIACFHKFSLRAGGDDWRVFDSGFSYANGEKGMLLVFNNGKLFNIVKDCDSDGRNSYYERVGVTYDHQEYDYGPPLDYAKMVLGQNTQENCKEWKMRFSSYDKEAHYNWGLAIVALPFAIVDKLTSSHDRSNQTSADWRYDAYDSAAIGLGETRTEVERRLGKSVDTDANGICTYIGDRTRPSKFVVLVKYDTDSCVEAVFNNAFRSRLLMKRVEVK